MPHPTRPVMLLRPLCTPDADTEKVVLDMMMLNTLHHYSLSMHYNS